MALEAMKRALASLRADPVAWTDEQELRDVEKYGCGYLFTAYPITPHADPRRVIKLYTIPPAPVVPDECPVEIRDLLASHSDALFHDGDAQEIWNACRAAMLQGAEPVTTAYKLPEGWVACSERMPMDGFDVLCASEFDGPGDWRRKVGYWHCGKWVVYGASWTPTHWMPLPAAPH
ncbi:DUF551 domain-containing protein [Enterobacter cloacae complex sp. P34C]|nr:DUF551 domain-containing protein [Enterobacter cloacae complex sp. P34C]MBE3284961.1 DUF551 domain-containing protein [Enterobacter cloacae complex sp. P33B]